MERPILTKFGEVMRLGHPATFSQWNFVNSSIQYGGRRHLEKSKNLNIFATYWPILTKFGMLMHLDLLYAPIANTFSLFQKIQDGGGGHYENSKNCNISTTWRPIRMTFSTMMSLCLPDTCLPMKFHKFENSRWQHPPLWKIEKS